MQADQEAQAHAEAEAGPSGESLPAENGAAPSPIPGKKPTRQWAAWTRQEEENFFIALRQVGKNFEKITSRVQSKNKNQVRHYYYRLIKRMNKLLGPGFVVDAKNTKDANAAMLRWWALLEKHSCSASKLHLKPRRFKTFVTALGHQLLKDRKKKKRKEPSQDAASSATGVTAAGPSKVVVSDPESAKALSMEAQSVQKSGSGKVATVKRNGGSCTNRAKREASNTKQPRQRRKASEAPLSSAAYKRWEKAACAGVTLVAEAAEQLERAAIAEQTSPEQVDLHNCSPYHCLPSVLEGTCLQKRKNMQCQASVVKANSQLSSSILGCKEPRKVVALSGVGDTAMPPTSLRDRPTTFDVTGATMPNHSTCQGPTAQPLSQPRKRIVSSLNTLAECHKSGVSERPENGMVKLKLQLFPMDEFTRKALEKDGHNPHLELTLKARKMISSVLQHLMQKWGHSTAASGELMLFPYSAQWKDLPNCQSWTLNETSASAGDVHAAVGSPTIFRLRYGWLSSRVLQISNAEPCQQPASIPSQMNMPQMCLQCQNKQTVKVRKLDVGRIKTKSPSPIQENMSGSVCAGVAFNGTQNSNMNKCTESNVPCCHVTTKAFHVYQDSGQSIILPLDSVQSTVHMSTVTSIKDPALPRRKLTSLTHEANRNEDTGVNYSESFPLESVKMSGDNCIVPGKGSQDAAPSICSGLAEPNLKNIVPEKSCGATEFLSQISCSSWINVESNDGFVQRFWEDEEMLRSNNGALLSTMDWVDSLTNISIGDLLNDASRAEHGNTYECLSANGGARPQPFLNYTDSFDAAIAAQAPHSHEAVNTAVTHSQSSIWDGEETRDAFAFQKVPFSVQDLGPVNRVVMQSSYQERFALSASIPEEAPFTEDLKMDSHPIEENQANELYWADSLGSLDIGIRPSGTHCPDLITGDISISLSGLIASSLDAFQNCSFFGSDKRVNTSVNSQDQHVHSLFATKEGGNNSLFITDNDNIGNKMPANSETTHELGQGMVDLHGAENQAINSGDNRPDSSEFVEACAMPTNDQKFLQDQVSGSNGSLNLHNACLRADPESKLLPLVGASVR